ncbi:MAG TPA: gamma-glutamyltransferase [Acidimicrobiales bacterium]|nr:gamma-glutamyltransferase [Acidimicrobiales bacterium]
MTRLAPFTTRYAARGMVCTVDHLASSAGVAMLRAGGSAVDAAVASSAVLAVTSQHLCGMGGDLFALVHRRGDTAPEVLNASGRAGSGADPARLRAAGLTRIPRTGEIAAVPVPGCVDGWVALHERFGRLPLAEVLAPAIDYAGAGFPASPTLALSARRLHALGDPETADYTSGGELHPGDLVRRPGVARALGDIAAAGRAGFYEGEFGKGLLALGGGEYTDDDLASPNADWVDPLSVDAWGRRIWTVPPNSQGYLTLAGAWIASGLDLPDDADDPRWAHLLVEAARQAAFDRIEVLHERADGRALIAPERLARRRDAIDPGRAASIGGTFGEGGTMYMCAVDGEGTGVSLIQSNFQGFGSMLIVPGVRIFLQNRGSAFSLEPGHPAEYGPRRRPPHTLAPALVTDLDGRLDCVLGTMGGDSQPHILLQLLARRFVSDERPGEAIAAPRFVLMGDEPGAGTWDRRGTVRVVLEDTAPRAWVDGLATLGHDVVVARAWGGDFGHASMIATAGPALAGAADPRALGGSAAGW